MTVTPECVWDLKCQLGEGPIWFDGAVWFVDIKRDAIHRLTPATGATKTFATPPMPGFIVPHKSGGFVVGLQAGLHRFDPNTGTFTPWFKVEPDKPGNRLNDGAVDPAGRLWFGSMDNGEKEATGSFYRLDASGPTAVDSGIVITNGPCFSPDGRVCYHTDTRAKTIYAFDVAANGGLSNKRVFVTIAPGDGSPDGSTIDSEGCVWTGLYNGWGARRYAPDGTLLTTVRFPVSAVTKIAFGGPDLKTVYATTASKHLDGAGRAKEPLAGSLFSFHADVAGLPQQAVATP